MAKLAFDRARSCFSILADGCRTIPLAYSCQPVLLPVCGQGSVTVKPLSTHLPLPGLSPGVTHHHLPRQIRLSGRHWACELVLQLEKDNGDPWQKIWFWGLFNEEKGPRAKG